MCSIFEIHEVLSYVHYRRCENTEALKDLKRALRTYRDLFGDDDTKVIHTVVSIGKFLDNFIMHS